MKRPSRFERARMAAKGPKGSKAKAGKGAGRGATPAPARGKPSNPDQRGPLERNGAKREPIERNGTVGTRPRQRDKDEKPAQPFQIEGRHPVLEALRAGRPLQRLLVARGERLGIMGEIVRLAREAGVWVEEVPAEELERRARTRAHQGVIALAAAQPLAEVGDIFRRARELGQDPLIMVAAEIQDPQNLGSLIRSAEAVGAHGLILPRHRSASLTPVVIKAAAGATEYLPVAQVTNLARTLEDFKAWGLWICGADAAADKLYHQADLRGPLAIVVGSEGRGIPRLVRERCDFLVRIPMAGNIASLNAAVAGAILLFESLRQRQLS